MALDFIAGCFGGGAGLVVGYPLDTIKVHIQTQDSKNPKYRGTWHCFSSLISSQSTAALYRGMSSPLAGVTIVNAIVFGVYAQVQKSNVDSSNLSTHFLAGAIAGLAQSPIASPLELAKTRMQLQSNSNDDSIKKYTGAIHCLRDIYKRNGLNGIFNGLGITALRETPSFGIYFLTYEALTRQNTVIPISTLHMLIAGGLAGTASWILTYPIDVIKSRLQADVDFKYNGAIDCFKKSIKQEGFICLFRGLNSTIIRAFPTNAATFAVVNWTFRIFDDNSIIKNIDIDKTQQQINHVHNQLNYNTFKNKINTLLNSLLDSSVYSSVTSDDSSTSNSGNIVEPDTVV
ncbi:hypothetical protein HCN44_001956 [Aphidius gifuensis]|uniref:Mitochondrial basic amino acids transporter n=1 Tax=Aphidius gifuensis TaxID=684658 RepID=A0A834Y3B5_APHGI|nr:mitochondrial basic amino acids transporter-like [Aphidius gifuensis]KAF7996324.1 hypothetical protein HCN44_001956 [Aphidius gifuensis]